MIVKMKESFFDGVDLTAVEDQIAIIDDDKAMDLIFSDKAKRYIPEGVLVKGKRSVYMPLSEICVMPDEIIDVPANVAEEMFSNGYAERIDLPETKEEPQFAVNEVEYQTTNIKRHGRQKRV